MIENFPKVMSNTKTQIQEAQNTKQDKCHQKHWGVSFLNYRKSKIKNPERNIPDL